VSVPTPALELTNVRKHFGRLRALDGATLRVDPGSVHALLGENGAGKTTLMRMVFGMVAPDGGTMRLFDQEGWPQSPAHAIARGIGMVHQHFTSIGRMTVAENIALGRHGRYDPAQARSRVEHLTRTTGLAIDPTAVVDTLPVGAQQRLEILKALARDARLLILDEPTAVLTPDESDELGGVLRALASRGSAVVVITHKLREARSMADHVTVLRHGRTVVRTPSSEATDEALADAMIGAQVAPAAPVRTARSAGPAILRARDLVLTDARGVERVRGVTLEVRAGEILGVAGVEGSGHLELLRALAGRWAPTSGALDLPDRVGFVPEDRHRDAVILDFSLTENVVLHDARRLHGRIRWRSWEARTRHLLETFDVRAATPAVAAGTLSGGNQQKLVLARELSGSPAALVVENPSRGLDIAATAAVHARLTRARQEGTAIVLYSSDLDELLALADRLIVLHAGRLRQVPADRTVVGRAMLGVS
jgi:ABC-type uncharacterized transport system ATPase subunit